MAQQKTAIFHFRGSMDKKSDDFVLVCTRTATSQNRRGLRRFFACSTKATDSQPLMSGFFCSTTDSTDNTDKKYDSRRTGHNPLKSRRCPEPRAECFRVS